MAAVAQATTHTHFIYHFQPPEGKVCTTGDNYEFNSRVGESLQKGITHNVVRGWFVRSINKGGQSFEIRFWLPSVASVNGVRRWTGLRSFSTCLVSVDFMLVTSPAIKDENITEKS